MTSIWIEERAFLMIPTPQDSRKHTRKWNYEYTSNDGQYAPNWRQKTHDCEIYCLYEKYHVQAEIQCSISGYYIVVVESTNRRPSDNGATASVV
jgi:hypothetical protein